MTDPTAWLAQGAALSAAATDGPWRVYQTMHAEPMVVGPTGAYPWDLIATPSVAAPDYGNANAAFIADARTRVDRLTAFAQAVVDACDQADEVETSYLDVDIFRALAAEYLTDGGGSDG